MNFYLEMTLLPHSEIGWHFLWEKLYQQVHLGLVAMKDEQERVPIGVSFPGRSVTRHHLGHQLRLFAETPMSLEQFDAAYWLSELSDYVHLTRIKPVPEKVKRYGCYFRIQLKSNNEQLARRRSKRHDVSLAAAMDYFQSRDEELADVPFVYVKSSSSGERFPLFIGYQDRAELSYAGFNCYGLSKQSTVPIF